MVILLCGNLGTWALAAETVPGDSTEAHPAKPVDKIDLRQAAFDSAAIGELEALPEYDYDRTVNEQELWWDRFKRWLGYQLNRLFGTRLGTAITRNLHYLILAAAILIVVWFLRRRLFSPMLVAEPHVARRVRELNVAPSSLDLDALLEQAEQQEDWHGALRIHYLKMLKHLVDEGRIRWQPENTDEDYLRQLKDPDERSRFRELSFLFRWAWFGDLSVDAERYHAWAPDFVRFHSPRTPQPA